MFLIALIATGAMIAPRDHSAQSICDVQQGCATPGKFDLAFMLDRSGSLTSRGQTWNLMVEGVLRVVRDATVIPRDGSIAVCVVAFDGAASITVPLTDINSADDAKKVADQIAALKCGDIHSQIFPCPFGETSWTSGILSASNNLSQVRSAKPKPGARRILYLVSDGSTSKSDLDNATEVAEEVRTGATSSGIPLMFDAFLMGVDPTQAEFTANKAALDQIVTPLSPKGSAGVTFVINPGPCNLEGADGTSADCSRQASDFAEKTRGTLRSNIASLPLVVTIETDTLPGVKPAQTSNISLRQAIELANCNGGAGNITFSTGLRGKTIRPLVALPALTGPDITISGCDPADSVGCTPLLTIDGGGQLADGISIRSNHDAIRGLRIINFTHAGVVIAPVCPSDNLGRNLVERNLLENNPTGILIFDQITGVRDGFNERNTISRNNISRAAPSTDAPPSALIDLGADGPTPNDAGDADQGPNTLLNFPDSLSVVSSGTGLVTITGQVSGPAVSGATVELYAITASHIASGKVVTDGVTFLGQTTVGSCASTAASSNCTFTATGVGASPTGNYTALITDVLGNTSELMFRADGRAAAGPGASFNPAIDFGSVTLNSSPVQRAFDIGNSGNAPLQITSCSTIRCAPTDRDDTARFSIVGCPGPTLQINPGERISLTISFATNVCGPAKTCLTFADNDLLHSPIVSTLTGQVGSNLPPTVTLEAGASSLSFGPVSPRAPRRGVNKLLKKGAFHTFTIANNGCNAFTLGFNSIRRVTDVAKCKITDANADDRNLFLVTQFSAGTETPVFPAVSTGPLIQLAPGSSLTFRVRFNPGVPPVVNKTCPDGTLIADEVLPSEISSVINISAIGGGVTSALTVPLTGKVTTDVRIIDPNEPSQTPIVAFCRSGNDFIAQFSVYDSNQNVDHADFQFTDSAGRTVGKVITVTGLDQIVAARNLALGQSFTVQQRFTGAADNSQVTRVQVTVFDKDGNSDSASSGPVNTGCSGVSAQSIASVRNATLVLPVKSLEGQNPQARPRSSRRQE